jgi:hypothetical protein
MAITCFCYTYHVLGVHVSTQLNHPLHDVELVVVGSVHQRRLPSGLEVEYKDDVNEYCETTDKYIDQQ